MIKFCFEDRYYHREPELIALCLKKCEYCAGVREVRIEKSFSYNTTLLFARGGNTNILANGKIYSVSDGKAAVIAPNFAFNIEKSTGCALYIIEFSCHPDVFAVYESDVTLFMSERDDAFGYARLYEKFRSGSPNERCEVILLDLLYGLLCSEKREKGEKCLYDRFCRYLRAHISEPLGVSDIARELGCSKDHLSRTVKKISGMTAKEYIVDMKLTLAKNMLLSNDTSVAQVGEDLGFPTTELFVKFLKYHLGKTALEIKKGSE